MNQHQETPPSRGVERALLGALLFDRDAIASVADRITPDAFADTMHAAIYRAVARCWAKQQPPDLITVVDELRTDPDAAYIQPTDLAELMTEVGTWGHWFDAPHYAERVVGHARSRAIAEAGARMVQHAGDADTDPALLMAETLERLDRFGAVEERQGPRAYAELVPGFQDRMLRQRSGELVIPVTPSGFGALDRKLNGGFWPGDLVILAARPSMGKTALALNFARNAAKEGKHTLFFSAEMNAESLLRREIAAMSGLSSEAVFTGIMSDEQFDRFLQASERLTEFPVSVDDTSGISTAQMLVRIQAEQRKHPLGLVIFDYIEFAGDQVKNDNEERRINAITKALKRIAMTCNVPVLALSQLNRGTETQSDKRPGLANLRHSGSIEQDADKVLFIYREAYYAAMSNTPVAPNREHIAEIIVAKNRNGATGVVDLFFKEDTMSFASVTTYGAPHALAAD